MSDDGEKNDAVMNATDPPSPMEIGVTPPNAAQDETGTGTTLITGKIMNKHK